MAESAGGNRDLLWYFTERPIPDEIMEGPFEEVWDYYRDEYLDDPDESYWELDEEGRRHFLHFLYQDGHVRQLLYDDPQSAPAWMLMEPTRRTLLPSSTWLLHFCTNATKIKNEGFRFGVPDINRIALTRENSIYGGPARRILYKAPGYNFAYPTDGSIMLTSRWNPQGYGKQALLFQSSGLPVHHSGDNEVQVVFWGPSANMHTAHVITATGRGFKSGDLHEKTLEVLVKKLKSGGSAFRDAKASVTEPTVAVPDHQEPEG